MYPTPIRRQGASKQSSTEYTRLIVMPLTRWRKSRRCFQRDYSILDHRAALTRLTRRQDALISIRFDPLGPIRRILFGPKSVVTRRQGFHFITHIWDLPQYSDSKKMTPDPSDINPSTSPEYCLYTTLENL